MIGQTIKCPECNGAIRLPSPAQLAKKDKHQHGCLFYLLWSILGLGALPALIGPLVVYLEDHRTPSSTPSSTTISSTTIVGEETMDSRLKTKLAWQCAQLLEDHSTPSSTPSSTTIVGTTIVGEKIMDSRLKNMLLWHVVIENMGKLSESYLRKTLNDLYREAGQKRIFKCHDGCATQILIYLYTSRDHYESGEGQWVAMLSEHKDFDKSPQISIRNDLLAQQDQPDSIKFGFSEPERKLIFTMIGRAEDRASNESEIRYPVGNVLDSRWNSDGKEGARALERMGYMDSLAANYKEKIAQQLGLSISLLAEINIEGLTKNWPLASQNANASQLSQEQDAFQSLIGRVRVKP